jgi:hypothetical protein
MKAQVFVGRHAELAGLWRGPGQQKSTAALAGPSSRPAPLMWWRANASPVSVYAVHALQQLCRESKPPRASVFICVTRRARAGVNSIAGAWSSGYCPGCHIGGYATSRADAGLVLRVVAPPGAMVFRQVTMLGIAPGRGGADRCR